MKNRIHYITKLELCKDGAFQWLCSNFDGKQIQNKRAISFLKRIVSDANNWSSITDWLTDLSWIKAEEYSFIFENYDSFLKDDLSSKVLFLNFGKKDSSLVGEVMLKTCGLILR